MNDRMLAPQEQPRQQQNDNQSRNNQEYEQVTPFFIEFATGTGMASQFLRYNIT
jgi:hypothetical protein